MNVHELTHSGLKPFACNTCQKTLTVRGNLKQHEKTHDDKKHIKCKTCNFPDIKLLAKHDKSHSICRPHVCKD